MSCGLCLAGDGALARHVGARSSFTHGDVLASDAPAGF